MLPFWEVQRCVEVLHGITPIGNGHHPDTPLQSRDMAMATENARRKPQNIIRKVQYHVP